LLKMKVKKLRMLCAVSGPLTAVCYVSSATINKKKRSRRLAFEAAAAPS